MNDTEINYYKNNKITIVLITYNESANIYRCLNSIIWADEVILVDSGSTDNTLNIAQQFSNVKIFIQPQWQGFGYQKNFALEKASNDWIFSIDADEVVDETLANNIQKSVNYSITSIKRVLYYVSRCNYFFNKLVRYSGWNDDKIIRLFHRNYAKFSLDKVHEKVILKPQSNLYNLNELPELDCLDGYLQHYSYTSFEQVLNKINSYSSLGAEQLYKQNKKSNLCKAIVHGLHAGFKTYVLKLGFLDGCIGFNIALMNALSSYYKYIKLTKMYK